MIPKAQKIELSRLISEETGVQHIFQHQNTKKPENRLFSSRFGDVGGTLRMGEKILTKDLDGNVYENRRFVSKIMWYIKGEGEGINEIAKDFCMRLSLLDVVERLKLKCGVSVESCSPVLDISEIVGDGYEEFCSFDVSLTTIHTVSKQINEIESVKIKRKA